MKTYFFSLVFLLSYSSQAMLQVTATLTQDNGESKVVTFDIDSTIFAQEICRLYQIPYTEPTADDILLAQKAHRDTCRKLNKEYVPLWHVEAKNLHNRVLGETMLDAIKEHRHESYPLIIEILAGKTAQNTNRLLAGS